MPHSRKSNQYLQNLVIFCLLILVAGCTMPQEPEGADRDGMTRLGDQLRERGNDAGAVDFYQRALQHKPDDIHAHTALAEILEAHGDNLDSINQYRAALKIDPDNAALHRALGRVFLKLHQPAEARDQYTQALQIEPGDIKASNGLGIALDYLGQHDAAQKIYHEVLEDQPDDLSTMNNLAHSWVLTGAYGEAIKLLEPHLHDRNATPALRQNLAEAYGMAGMEADAERVGRIDLTPEQVKRNLAFYRTQRAQITPTAGLMAELGVFATEALAQVHLEEVKTTFAKEIGGLVLTITPEVKSIGGTPKFMLQATGFSQAKKLRSFCDRLKKEHFACNAQGLGN